MCVFVCVYMCLCVTYTERFAVSMMPLTVPEQQLLSLFFYLRNG